MHPRSPPWTMGCMAWPVHIPGTRGHHPPPLLKLDFCPSPLLHHVTPKYPGQTLPANTGAGKEVTLEGFPWAAALSPCTYSAQAVTEHLSHSSCYTRHQAQKRAQAAGLFPGPSQSFLSSTLILALRPREPDPISQATSQPGWV